MAFSATEAALEGFRIARAKPKAMLFWALASLVISFVGSVGMVTLFGSTMNRFATLNETPQTDPSEIFALMGQMALLYLFLIPLLLFIFAVFTCAVYRAVLKPDEDRLAYLRLGGDEWRQAVVMLVLGLLGFVATLAVVFVLAIFMGVLGVATGAGGSGGAPGIGFFIGMILLYLGMIAVSVAFWVKFSFAGPMTFVDKRIRIFQSWKATNGYFWPLFGSYFLAFILGALVSALGGVISFAVMVALGASTSGGVLEAMQSMEGDFTSLATYFTPAIIANMVVSAFFSALTYAIFLAPPAVAYRDIIRPRSPAVADDFS